MSAKNELKVTDERGKSVPVQGSMKAAQWYREVGKINFVEKVLSLE